MRDYIVYSKLQSEFLTQWDVFLDTFPQETHVILFHLQFLYNTTYEVMGNVADEAILD
jgi:hypothetical protein